MIPIAQCSDSSPHGEHEWNDESILSWCEGVQLPPTRDTTNQSGSGVVKDRRDF